MRVLGKQAQARVGNVREGLPVLQGNYLKMPAKFAEWRPVGGNAITLLKVEAQLAHEIDTFLPELRMPGRHLDVTLDIRKDAVGANRLDVDVRLRGARLSPLVLANGHRLDGRIGQRTPHHLTGNPEPM